MQRLNIDIETYSSVQIGSCGAYKYAESPDFEILLFAYAIDGGEVRVVDLASGETIPGSVLDALEDPGVLKYAYNAAFEWNCLGRFLGRRLPVEQWRCTMVHGLYAGYPAGLEAIGLALGLSADKAKLSTGKALIRYFCQPCAPTKANGGRTRNLPQHEPEKWQLFKEYNAQDVRAEMEVGRLLAPTPVPELVQREWETDMRINARGVRVDMGFVEGALAVGEVSTEKLLYRARSLTGLDNPNSIARLRDWVNDRVAAHGYSLDDLSKATVADVLEGCTMPDDVREVLQLRQELGKTSTKKYDAIRDCVCADDRVRGLLQFYGARTGRWAGRLVQVQNLPRTYTDPIDPARDLIRAGNHDGLKLLYGSVPDTLSQLIRTAFIASPGHILIDADFSAIEARVIAWLAGEQWRLETFRAGGDIYCASASQMFGVPVEKHGVNGHLRQKGKIAELALGYGGGPGAMVNMGALSMGIKEEELGDIVASWRAANPAIVRLWGDLNRAAFRVIEYGGRVQVGPVSVALERDSGTGAHAMTIRLPSGRDLRYIAPMIGENRWGNRSIMFYELDAAHQWGLGETYGGKLTENVVQAIARDALSQAIEKLETAGYPIVFHVHDEVVIDKDPAGRGPDELLADVVRIMGEPISWAPGLPLNADGWTGQYFRKD